MASTTEQIAAFSTAPQARVLTRVHTGATPSVMAFAADDATRDALATACEGTGLAAAVHPGGVEACLHCIADIPPGTTVIVDFDGCDIPEADAAVISTMAPAGVRLIATSSDNQSRKILAEAGISDFLSKPPTSTTLSALFGGLAPKAPEIKARAATVYVDPPEAVSARPAAVAPSLPATMPRAPEHSSDFGPRLPAIEQKQGRIIAVLGVRGGVGASSLASGIACSLAKDFALRTALVDLDLAAGTQLLAVNAQAGTGLRESLESPARLDGHMVDRLAIKLNENLHLFGAEENPDLPALTDAQSAADLIRHIASHYRRIVIDVPRTVPNLSTAVLALADEIILVGDLTLAGARDLLRHYAWLHRARPNTALRLVSGGATPPQRELVASAEFRRLCGHPIDMALPFEATAAADASRGGRPLASVNNRIAKAVRALVGTIEGHEPARRSFAFWRSKNRGRI